jgi:hypothetical protein
MGAQLQAVNFHPDLNLRCGAVSLPPNVPCGASPSEEVVPVRGLRAWRRPYRCHGHADHAQLPQLCKSHAKCCGRPKGQAEILYDGPGALGGLVKPAGRHSSIGMWHEPDQPGRSDDVR